MWRDLLVGEAHSDPYLWAVVALAHAFLGMGAAHVLRGLLGRAGAALTASAIYACWEVYQGLLVDGLLDWSAFTLGALMIRWPVASWLSVIAVALIGAWVRM